MRTLVEGKHAGVIEMELVPGAAQLESATLPHWKLANIKFAPDMLAIVLVSRKGGMRMRSERRVLLAKT